MSVCECVYTNVYIVDIFRQERKIQKVSDMETGIVRTRRTNMYCKLVGFSVPVSRSLLVSFATVCVHVCLYCCVYVSVCESRLRCVIACSYFYLRLRHGDCSVQFLDLMISFLLLPLLLHLDFLLHHHHHLCFFSWERIQI